MHRIDILFFDGCPNHLPAVGLVKSVVNELSLDAAINEIEVLGSDDAVSHRFLGSPSIHVDGIDIEPAARERTDYGFSCRTYSGSGLPARSMLVSALSGVAGSERESASQPFADCCDEPSAREPNAENWGFLASSGSVLVAMTASACCWLPLVLIAFGLSAGGLGTAFETARPYTLAASIGLLAAGFYFAYRIPKCEPGSDCEASQVRMRRLNRRMLWAATVVVIAFAALPLYIGVLLPDSTDASTITADVAGETVKFHVNGMTCEACAFALRDELVGLEGVVDARVDYKTGRVDLLPATESVETNESILEAIHLAGFQGTVLNDDQEN